MHWQKRFRRDEFMNTDTTSLLLTADEVAAMLGVSERTLWRLLSAGKAAQAGSFRTQHPLACWREVKEWIERGCPVG